MARIRTIKPEFPHSESMGRVSRDARLTFIELWTLADDAGRLRGNSRMLASLLFPYDDDAKKLMGGWLTELERENCIQRYCVEGTSYIQICNWLSHQKIDKPSPSKLPPFDESSRILANPREGSSGDQDQDQGSRKGMEGIKDQLVASERDERAQSVFEHWQREWNHLGTKLDQKRKKRIEARLKDFTADQLCNAISGFRHSPWHNGTDAKSNGTVFDSIDTLLRDTAQVEKGMALFAHPPRPPPRAETPGQKLMRTLNGDDDSRVIEHDPAFPALTGH
jgi:hypothetical protein